MVETEGERDRVKSLNVAQIIIQEGFDRVLIEKTGKLYDEVRVEEEEQEMTVNRITGDWASTENG